MVVLRMKALQAISNSRRIAFVQDICGLRTAQPMVDTPYKPNISPFNPPIEGSPLSVQGDNSSTGASPFSPYLTPSARDIADASAAANAYFGNPNQAGWELPNVTISPLSISFAPPPAMAFENFQAVAVNTPPGSIERPINTNANIFVQSMPRNDGYSATPSLPPNFVIGADGKIVQLCMPVPGQPIVIDVAKGQEANLNQFMQVALPSYLQDCQTNANRCTVSDGTGLVSTTTLAALNNPPRSPAESIALSPPAEPGMNADTGLSNTQPTMTALTEQHLATINAGSGLTSDTETTLPHAVKSSHNPLYHFFHLPVFHHHRQTPGSRENKTNVLTPQHAEDTKSNNIMREHSLAHPEAVLQIAKNIKTISDHVDNLYRNLTISRYDKVKFLEYTGSDPAIRDQLVQIAYRHQKNHTGLCARWVQEDLKTAHHSELYGIGNGWSMRTKLLASGLFKETDDPRKAIIAVYSWSPATVAEYERAHGLAKTGKPHESDPHNLGHVEILDTRNARIA